MPFIHVVLEEYTSLATTPEAIEATPHFICWTGGRGQQQDKIE